MAQITLNIPNEHLTEVAEALAFVGGYQETIDGSPNPVTKNQFAKVQVIKYVKNAVKEYRAQQALASVVEPNDMDIT